MEIWKEIKGYEGYEVSNLGRVKSLKRKKEIFFLFVRDGGGYLQVVLCKNTKTKTKKVHKLVAIMFLNHKPSGYKLVVDHIDNNKLNNKTINIISMKIDCLV